MHKDWSDFLFYENFSRYCKMVGKAESVVAKEIGRDSKTVTGWKNGAIPYNSTLKRLADYFGVTVEDLLADKKEPAGEGELKYEWSDVEEAFKNATPEARAAAKAAALAVLESGKREKNGV